MTASGEIIHCSRRQNKEIFLAALCSLGAVGIILTVTWQCEPAFRLHQQSEPKLLEEVWFKVVLTGYSKRKTSCFLITYFKFKLPGMTWDCQSMERVFSFFALLWQFLTMHNAVFLSCAFNSQDTLTTVPNLCTSRLSARWAFRYPVRTNFIFTWLAL